MKRVCLVFSLCLLIVAACNKREAEEVYPELSGTWISDTLYPAPDEIPSVVRVTIDGSNSEYGFICPVACDTCPCQGSSRGLAKVNRKGDQLIIGKGEHSIHYISELPAIDSVGREFFVLNDRNMYKN